MSESADEGVDIPTRDPEDVPAWQEPAGIDWVDVWETFGFDSPGPDFRRSWLPERLDIWGVSKAQVQFALRAHPETPDWGHDQIATIVDEAIIDGSLHSGPQAIVCPAAVLDDE